MSDDTETHRRNFAPPWSSKHKVPTVQGYRETQQSRANLAESTDDTKNVDQDRPADDDGNGEDDGYEDTSQVAAHADVKTRRKEMKHRTVTDGVREVTDPVTHLPVEVQDFTDKDLEVAAAESDEDEDDEESKPAEDQGGPVKIEEAELEQIKQGAMVDGHQVDLNELVAMLEKQAAQQGAGSRRVRPIDRFGKEYGVDRSTGMGLYTKSQSRPTDSLGRSTDAKRLGMYPDDATHDGTAKTAFLPPEFEHARKEIAGIIRFTMLICLTMVVLALGFGVLMYWWLFISLEFPDSFHNIFIYAYPTAALAFVVFAVAGFIKWAQNMTEEIWDDEVAIAAERHRQTQQRAQQQSQEESEGKQGVHHLLKRQPETTNWLNSLVGSVWPLINPDLFASVADMLEDVMQASLPRLVRMVSVEDLGQGSEPFRILGIRWLPKGKAAEYIGENGRAKAMDDGQHEDNDTGKTKSDEEDKVQSSEEDDMKKDESGREHPQPEDGQETDSSVLQGMEAEEGEFINMEIAFAYRAPRRRVSKTIKAAHLYLAFYLPGAIKLPVWVTLRGIVGTMRARLQLMPDPPFFGLATITFLGQPRVTMSCVPLVKQGLNIMDVPLISNFVQSAVDAAMAEYVAPKSLTIDLQSMLAGDDFKKDTDARGIFRVQIKHAFDFKFGDMAIPLIREASADTYVSVGWAKFGKPVWSTRVIVDNMEPYWEETAFVPVGPEELDADEKLRIQLWDSDRFTADDDLGRVELDIKMLMRNENSKGKMWDRVDSFHALKAGEKLPGRFEWSVGYYSKTKLMEYQVAQQKIESDVKTVDDLRAKVYERAAKKLRETVHDETAEIEQQKEQDFDKVTTEIIASTPACEDYPSGILSIQIHQIMGLQLEEQGKTRDPAGELEGGEDKEHLLPDSYCTIILNHQKIFKTRTKPKNSKPFFNAVTERFIRDWRSTTIFISVRDARVHEDDPLLGLVYLPLGQLIEKRKASCINETFPLAGGVGYGRMRVSLCFRSVELQLPRNLLGWDTYGTLAIDPETVLTPVEGENRSKFVDQICSHSVKLSTALSSIKMHPTRSSKSADGPQSNESQTLYRPHRWHGSTIYLGVQKRYAAHLLLTFAHRSSSWFSSLLGSSAADGDIYAILWLRDLPDATHALLELPVYIGDAARAGANVLPPDKRGTQIATVRVGLKYQPGLDHRVHHALYKRSQDVRDVVEVLETAIDNGLLSDRVGKSDPSAEVDGEDDEHAQPSRKLEDDERDDSASSDDGDDSTENTDAKANDPDTIDPDTSSYPTTNISNGDDKKEPEKAGDSLLASAASYRTHQAQLHRRHRGLMQWKASRTLRWVANKGRRAVAGVADLGGHEGRAPGVETEV